MFGAVLADLCAEDVEDGDDERIDVGDRGRNAENVVVADPWLSPEPRRHVGRDQQPPPAVSGVNEDGGVDRVVVMVDYVGERQRDRERRMHAKKVYLEIVFSSKIFCFALGFADAGTWRSSVPRQPRSIWALPECALHS